MSLLFIYSMRAKLDAAPLETRDCKEMPGFPVRQQVPPPGPSVLASAPPSSSGFREGCNRAIRY